MIQKIDMFTVVCDSCGEILEVHDYSCWPDEISAASERGDSDWINEKGKDYCPKCFFYDGKDNLIIKDSNLYSKTRIHWSKHQDNNQPEAQFNEFDRKNDGIQITKNGPDGFFGYSKTTEV